MYYIDANDSSEDEAERWEREQLRKAVGYKKVVELHDQMSAYRQECLDLQHSSSISLDHLLREDIEVIELTNDPDVIVLDTPSPQKPNSYADMSQLLQTLEYSVTSRREEIKTKQYHLEECNKRIEEHRASIVKVAETILQLERDLQQHQEKKLNPDTKLNCSDDEIIIVE